MKKNRIFGALSAAALLFAGACSNDVIDQGSTGNSNDVNPEDGLYLTVTFDLPSAKETRSQTDGPNSSSSGTEEGRDYENVVSSAYIVLATPDNDFIVAGEALTVDPVGTTGRSYRNTAKFQKTDLAEYYTNAQIPENVERIVNVFVFANPTAELKSKLKNIQFGDKEWVNYKGTYEESATTVNIVNEIWTENKFLMSNVSIAPRKFPPTLDDWDAHSTAATAFNLSGINNFGRPNEIDNLTNLGNIEIERTAARYDFRDGALDGIDNPDKSYNGFKAQTYHVVLDSDEKALVDVYLGKMSMVNMNREYYFLRRTSLDGLSNATQNDGKPNYVSLLGPEVPVNGIYVNGEVAPEGSYVVDAFADWKYSGNNEAPTSGFAGHFNYPFFDENGVMDNIDNDRWGSSYIEAVLKGETDNWTSEAGKGKYHTWRYLTEGTIPGILSQKNGVSNGIVFKGLLQPARKAVDSDDEFTKKLLAALETSQDGNKLHDPILYTFGGHIYCTWDHIRRMAIYLSLTGLSWNANDNKWDFTINRSTTIYNAVFGTGGFGEVSFACEQVANADLKNADFLKTGGVQRLIDNLTPDPNAANTKYNEWKAAFPEGDDSVDADEEAEFAKFTPFRDAAVGNNITLYQTSFDENMGGYGYYCYYFYWNRHNDNSQSGVMGPMEFAVVRNNVYKLAVTKIARLGHPRIAANDPDKPTPNTPDEKADVYITVTCTTLPWVVRENNIEF